MITVESPDLRAVQSALSATDDSLRSGDLAGEAAAPLTSDWLPELSTRAVAPQDQRVLVDGATALVQQGTLVLNAAQSTVPLSGGLVPAERWASVEYGSHFAGLPPRSSHGRVIMASASRIGRRFVGAVTNAIVSAYRRAVGDETNG